MFSNDQYQLLDFGHGRKLERFGRYVVDRPCPAADAGVPRYSQVWLTSAAQYHRRLVGREGRERDGQWRGQIEAPWMVTHGAIRLELRLTPFGHVGLFPEQAANWDWIADQVARMGPRSQMAQPPRVLNLFAYTGASTLAAAAAGAQVTHVDAARNLLSWARKNADLSGLADAPVRWIAEDAPRFVQRELRRGNHYQGVVLDPPTYGHGPKGQVWKIERDLVPLLGHCVKLLDRQPSFLLLTCHSTGCRPADLRACVSDVVAGLGGEVSDSEMSLNAVDGRSLAAGVAVRWSR